MRFVLVQNLSTQLGSPCTRTQTKHMPANPTGVVVLSASSPGEVELGSAYSLQSNDGGGSESHSMSFTWPDLRGSREKEDNRGLYEIEDPRSEHRV